MSPADRNGVANATVSIVGLPGIVKTDAEGRFTWKPRPEAPFQVIVMLPGGQVASPFTVETLDGGLLTVEINPLAQESLSVVGAAPSINATPAAATTMLSSRQIAQRSPEHLLQALETVPGINQVSEGHASVPAIRGMARGRTLLLDRRRTGHVGAPRGAERDVRRSRDVRRHRHRQGPWLGRLRI